METLKGSKSLQFLNFKLVNVNLCMDIQYITKVLPLMDVEKIPQSPLYVCGLMNISGQSIPLIDLALFLAMEREKNYTLDMPILLCAHNNEQLAFIVDETIGLSDIQEAKLQKQHKFSGSHSFFSAINIEDHEQFLLLNMQKIFASCSSFQINLLEQRGPS